MNSKKPYFIIEVREKHVKSLRRYFVSDSGSITLNQNEAAKFPERYEWAVNTLIDFWNKQNRCYQYSKVKVYSVDVKVTTDSKERVCECEVYERCQPDG